MSIKRNVFIFILMIVMLNFLLSDLLLSNIFKEDVIDKINPHRSQQYNKIIGLHINEYQEYLLNNFPLDRLYMLNDIIYFIVTPTEYKKVLNLGIKPFNIKKRPINQHIGRISNTDFGYGNSDYNGAYHSYYETKDILNELQEKYPQQAKVFSIGKSVENRDINIIQITNFKTKVGNVDNVDKKNIFIVGCHHAREWISVEIPLLFAKFILEQQENDNIKKALNGANIYILPILNPDGLEFSIHNYRYWRKNRKYNGNFIWGVDLNRNYGYMWGINNEGSSPFSKSEAYRGTEPFSEPETEALRRFLLDNPPDGTISYHNYSQLILMPWGYKYEKPESYEELKEIASEMSKRIYEVNGRVYNYGGAEALYLVNGELNDWIYGRFKIPAFTIELPPTSSIISGGFFTSEEEIKLSFEENLPALLYFINYFIDKDYKKQT